ncbi:glycosyltransferase [bacterium]|nr:glycosyltransferase [bacterium]
MNVTIAIATHNRAREVEKTLRSLVRLEAGQTEYEVLLVDNNGTDDTAAVAAGLAPQFEGRLRYVREARPGLSHARNRAIDEARHEVIAYLDDDVDVAPSWLNALRAAYASGDVAGVGGRAYLVYPARRPRWLSDTREALLTRVELGPDRRPSGAGELYGVNLSFRKAWLIRSGGFRTDLGRVGTTLTGGEDCDMLERVASLGGLVLYEPGAVVGHRVPRGRLTRTWFWKRCYWGHVAVPRQWPDHRVCGYELVRSAWHVGLMTYRAVRAGIGHGPHSPECFDQVLDVASRLGTFTGLAREFRHRVRGSFATNPTGA